MFCAFRFGDIVDIALVCRDSNSQPFAYVAFKEATSASKARIRFGDSSSSSSGGGGGGKQHQGFRVEARRTFPLVKLPHALYPSSPKTPAEPAAVVGVCEEEPPPPSFTAVDLGWSQEVANFNWRACAAKYLCRTVTMEDYLIEYIHTQASYRGIDHEPIEDLVVRLQVFAERKPNDLVEMMPPSVSGVVYNQTREPHDFLDTLSRLLPQDKFR